MSTQRYVAIMLSAAALFAVASLPGTATATELPVPARVVEKPQTAPAARPAVRVVRPPFRSVRRSYGPVGYVNRPTRGPVQYAALDRRWPVTQLVFLGVGF